jgi:hypothetical protein
MNFYVGKVMMLCASPHTIVNLTLSKWYGGMSRVMLDRKITLLKALVPSFITLLSITTRLLGGSAGTNCSSTHLLNITEFISLGSGGIIFFLHTIKQKRNEGFNIVYLDETWVDTHHTANY